MMTAADGMSLTSGSAQRCLHPLVTAVDRLYLTQPRRFCSEPAWA